MGHPPHQGDQKSGSGSQMEERILWLITQGRVMLDLHRKGKTPEEKEQVRGELTSLFRQVTEVSPVLSIQRRYRDLLTLQQVQLEITRILKDQRGEGIILGGIGSTYLALRQYPKAQNFLEQAVPLMRVTENQAGLCTALHNLGEVCRLTKRYEEALRLYDQSLAINPSRPVCWYVKGIVLEQLGHQGEAINSYRESLRLKPDFEPARHALTRLGIAF